jgi:hypothetical protein
VRGDPRIREDDPRLAKETVPDDVFGPNAAAVCAVLDLWGS